MYLKTLELSGFKSFADKVTFAFDQGVSAIVGPNGSGKSNVVDAIRWVLGEQSVKSLRGSKMEDVIFSGSAGRKPVGMARVTMLLDNSERRLHADYDEIEITRTLHRSGESEYRINQETCRLKDVHELFMDTGLGRDGFSVIGQGKIEEILTLHAEERRGLIEEAAGISKYKYRKKEAQRKLQATEDDQERLDDLLFELEARLEPLAKQAEQVEAYQRCAEEEKHLQLALFQEEYTHLRTGLESDGDALVAQENGLVALTAQLHADEAAEEAHRNDLDRVRSNLEVLQQDYMAVARAHDEVESKRQLSEERLAQQRRALVENAATLDAERASHAKEMAETEAMQADYERLQAEVQAVMRTEKHDAAQLLALDQERVRLSEHHKHLQNTQFDLMSKQATARNDIIRLEQEESSHEARKARIGDRLQQIGIRLEQVQKELAGYETTAATIAADEEALQKTLETQMAQLQVLDQENAVQGRRHDQLQETLHKGRARLDTLRELESAGDGYYQGVQSVLRHQQSLQGICGTVIQLLDIPTQYLQAMESALGAAAQNIVVENDADARAAIAWLKEKSGGRATFMPLNTVRGRRSDTLLQDEHLVGLAADLVQCDEKYRPIVDHLLGRVWVATDIREATRIGRAHGFNVRIVTLDGDILAAGGTMTGGRHRKQSSIVQRKNEMNALETRLTDTTAALEVCAQTLLNNRTAVAALNQTVRTDNDALQHVRVQRSANQVELERCKQEIARHQADLGLEERDAASIYDDQVHARTALREAEDVLAGFSEHLHTLESDMTETNAALEAIQEQWKEAQELYQNQRVANAQLQEKDAALKSRLADRLLRVKQLTESIQRREDNARTLQNDIERLEAETTRYHEDRREKHAQYLELETLIGATKDSLQTIEQTRQTIAEGIKVLRVQREDDAQTLNQLRLQIDKSEGRVATIEEKLFESYALTPETAFVEPAAKVDLKHAQSRVKALRREMQSFGELNFTAVEEYKSVSERVTFLSAQLNDLKDAKEKLEKIIADMEATMSRKFKETYIEVNQHFNEIFQLMFSGGHAKLELSMPHNYLETGIEIVAQPPGKRERVLTLLSGGERAMTAIALLFALLEVRPSPFVILDEIEAALDEANVERFAAFIKRYAQKTQFIMISHRRGTIEAAGVLYGITMDRDGISQQVSVKVTDYTESED